MRPRVLSEVARVTDGRLRGDDARVTGAAADSREVRPGDLFVAIPGERVDGHSFVGSARARGAAGAMVERLVDDPMPQVVVTDTVRGLLDLGADQRSSMDASVVGITGSTGKTSVKDLAAAVLATRYRVSASVRSYNTEVGVPLTLLAAPPDAEAVVCEMGARGRGHIALLCRVARPRIGVITGIGVAHMELFGTREAIAEAKAELIEALPEDGTAVLFADDPVVRGLAGRTSASVLLYGTGPEAAVRAEQLTLDRRGLAAFTLRTPAGDAEVHLSVAGEHMAHNALAAAACGVALGLTPSECAEGLAEGRLSGWRMEVTETADGLTVINDAYNANPQSMAAALKTARWIARERRCIAVLGVMAELGGIADAEHERIGELAARLRVDRLVVVGTEARMIAAGAVREGVEPDRVTVCGSVDEALAAVRGMARRGDVVLVKASRAAGLERVALALTGQGTASPVADGAARTRGSGR